MIRKMLPAGRSVLIALCLTLAACHDQPKNVTVVNGESIPQLLAADTALGKPEERLTIRSTYDGAIEALKKNSDDPGPYLKLAEAYIMQSRISGNSAYYQAAVLQVLNKLITTPGSTGDQRFIAYMYKSNVLFGMNRFRDALEAANEGLKLGEGNAGIWATVSDANLELGNYPEARNAGNRMMKLRPDLRSYARLAYLKELSGDLDGALGDMVLAVESGVAGLETTEWARVQLGDLCLNTGKLDSARNLYTSALEFRPGYAAANDGLARLATLRRDYPAAIRSMEAATTAMEDPLYLARLAELYNLSGNGTKAAAAISRALDFLKREESGVPATMQPKPAYAREYAIVYRAARNYPKMLQYARTDHQERPENAEANQLLAWAIYLNSDPKAAVAPIEKALAIGWKNPELLQQASIIHRKAGDLQRATALETERGRIRPLTDPVLDAESR